MSALVGLLAMFYALALFVLVIDALVTPGVGVLLLAIVGLGWMLWWGAKEEAGGNG